MPKDIQKQQQLISFGASGRNFEILERFGRTAGALHADPIGRRISDFLGLNRVTRNHQQL